MANARLNIPNDNAVAAYSLPSRHPNQYKFTISNKFQWHLNTFWHFNANIIVENIDLWSLPWSMLFYGEMAFIHNTYPVKGSEAEIWKYTGFGEDITSTAANQHFYSE